MNIVQTPIEAIDKTTTEASTSLVTALRQQLSMASKDKTLPRGHRDFIKAALDLTASYDDESPSEEEIMRQVFQFILVSIARGDQIADLREVLEALVEERCTPERVKITIEKAGRSLGEVPTVQPSSTTSSTTYKPVKTDMLKKTIAPINARITHTGKNNITRVLPGGEESVRVGHKMLTRRGTKSPFVGDFSLIDEQKNTRYECYGPGDAKYQLGHTLNISATATIRVPVRQIVSNVRAGLRGLR